MANTQQQAGSKGRVQVIRSSLPYQVLLYLNGWYFGFFFLCEILIYVFKGETLPYAENVLLAEVILLFVLAAIEALRLFFECLGFLVTVGLNDDTYTKRASEIDLALSGFAQKGNLTERIVGVVVSILLSVPAILGTLFLLLWQTYVLRVDLILAAIQLAFIGLELIMGIVSIINFARATPY